MVYKSQHTNTYSLTPKMSLLFEYTENKSQMSYHCNMQQMSTPENFSNIFFCFFTVFYFIIIFQENRHYFSLLNCSSFLRLFALVITTVWNTFLHDLNLVSSFPSFWPKPNYLLRESQSENCTQYIVTTLCPGYTVPYCITPFIYFPWHLQPPEITSISMFNFHPTSRGTTM